MIGSEDVVGAEDEPDGMPWPGNELLASPYFTDVEQHELTITDTMHADDMVGLMSTISAYLLLPDETRPPCSPVSVPSSPTPSRYAATSASTALAVPPSADPSQMAASEWATRRRWRRQSGRPVADGGV